MDPLSALSLASTIVQFVDFSIELVQSTKQIYESTSGANSQNEDYISSATELQRLCQRLCVSKASPDSPLSPDQEALNTLATRCQRISKDLIALLERTKPSDRESKWRCFVAAIKTHLKRGESELLLRRLAECRSQLEIQILRLSRYGDQAPPCCKS